MTQEINIPKQATAPDVETASSVVPEVDVRATNALTGRGIVEFAKKVPGAALAVGKLILTGYYE